MQRHHRPVLHAITRFGVVAGALLLPVALAGCALLEGPAPKTPERTKPPVADEDVVLDENGTAEENLPFFTKQIHDYAESEEPVLGAPIVDALRDAGFDGAAMQVSFDRSKTDLAADSIYVSVLWHDGDCLIGQIVTEDRDYAADVMPAVGPDRSICLIGETRPIDW